MKQEMVIDGRVFEIAEAELHVVVEDDSATLYLGASNTMHGGFGLWEVHLTEVTDLHDLDGAKLHANPNGDSYDDDTLGSDMVGSDLLTDLNYWSTGQDADEIYLYGEIEVDFKRIEGNQYHCHVSCTLTDSDEDPEDLTPEDYNISASADFDVTADTDWPE